MNLLTLKEVNKGWILDVIDKAIAIKKNPSKYAAKLKNKSLAMIFQKTSTRTRVSFEVAMTQLGGHAIFLDWHTTQLGISDLDVEAKTISRYVDILAARMKKHGDLQIIVHASEVPVINMCDEKYHPCQILADLMTIKEKKGTFKNIKLLYVGIGNNISNTLIVGCTKIGIKFTLCVPERHHPSIDNEMLKEAIKSGNYYEEKDPKKAIIDADIVYTDSWVDMELFSDPSFQKEKHKRVQLLKPYQINKTLIERSNALIMHDMPVHPGYEITKDMVYDKRSIIFDQAENRLHVQKAILLKLLNKI